MHFKIVRIIHILIANHSDRILQIDIPLDIGSAIGEARHVCIDSLDERFLNSSFLNAWWITLQALHIIWAENIINIPAAMGTFLNTS